MRRWGRCRLAEILLYTVRRTMTMAGPSAAFLDPEVEGWLIRRMAAASVRHVVNAPSNPPGWTAVLRFFKWDVNTQSAEALDLLEPFHTAELRPV